MNNNKNIAKLDSVFAKILSPSLVFSENSIRINGKSGVDIKRHTLKVLILTSTATIKNDNLQEIISKYNKYFDVYAEPADKIRKFVENDTLDTYECNNYLEDLFSSYKDTDYLIIAEPLLQSAEIQIREVLGNKIKIYQ